MLTKSQARTFFIGFTVLFSGVFLGLTVDTIRQVPARSNEDQMTADVVKGKEIWEANNCMGCHTLLGEGGYYAPELTKVVERRGEAWIRIFIRDPEAMYPGRRRMVKYDFSEEEITQVIAFLDWIGKIDTNGFPRKPDMTTAGIVAANAATTPATADTTPTATPADTTAATTAVSPPPAFFTQVCQACHAVGGTGGAVGPALDGVATRYTPEKLDAWLKDPQSVKPGTAMPNLALPDATRAELVTWLMQLD
jgi:nitric oxide reductase subunit C